MRKLNGEDLRIIGCETTVLHAFRMQYGQWDACIVKSSSQIRKEADLTAGVLMNREVSL